MSRLFQATFWLACLTTGVLSLMPVEQLPQPVFDLWDKAQHAVGFALLTLLGRCAFPRSLARLTFGLLAYGAVIEFAQSATGWRHGDARDWLADAIGIAVGLALAQALSIPWRSRFKDSARGAQ